MTWFWKSAPEAHDPDGPSLDEFIRDALVDIAFGVHQAKLEAKDLVAIAPGRLNDALVEELTHIEFDLAVTVGEMRGKSGASSSGIGGRISVLAASISTDIDGRSERTYSAKNERINRIQFKVPVRLNANYRSDTGMAAEAQLVEKLAANRLRKRAGQ